MAPFAPLATPRLTPEIILSRLTKMTAKTSGLSSVFMLAQYSSPLVVGLLLALARLRARYAVDGGRTLRNMAKGWGNVSNGAAEARIVMRTAGMLPIIQWLLALHPDPVASIKALFKVRSLSALSAIGSSAKLIPTIQALSLGVYYPAEHVWYLASKGFLGLSPAATARAGAVLIQGWAVYVVVEVYKIAIGYAALRKRTLRLQNRKHKVDVEAAEGYELQDEKDSTAVKTKAEAEVHVGPNAVDALKNDWEDWWLNAAVYAGYAPLTAHWMTPGGLGPMKNPWVQAGLGTLTAVASVLSQWKAAAV